MLSREYLAGLFDGEGYIGVIPEKGTKHMRYRVEITNQHKGILEQIQAEFGGRLWLKYGQRECWQLSLENKEKVKYFLTVIEPHLIIKKEKAKAALKLVL